MGKNRIAKMFLTVLVIALILSMISSVSATELTDNPDTANEGNIITAELTDDSDTANEGNIITAEVEDDEADMTIEDELIAADETTLNDDSKSQLTASNSIYVSADGRDENGYGTKSKPYKSLDYAIKNSGSDATIYLAKGNYIGNNNRNITIDKTLKIIGENSKNTIIDAESSSRIFIMNSNAKLTLINLTLLNGHGSSNETTGGTICNEGGQLTIINSTIMNSSGCENGGAIYNNLGVLNIYNTNFINNSAMQYGGVIYTLGQNHMENTNFTGNFLTNDLGVGACVALGGTGTFKNCNFIDNYAIYSAAGILNLGNITIDNCSFFNLTTNYTAGGISNHNYALINNSYFGYNGVRYYAAAILAPPSGQHVKTEVYNSIFEYNHAGNHAAVSNNYKDTELYMKNCAILNNYIRSGVYFGDISLDDNATLEYCWWGQNEISPYYYSPHDSNYDAWKINASRWLVMTFTSSNGIIYQDKDNVLTVDLRHYFDNDTKQIYEYNENINLPLTVKLYTEGGRVLKTMKLVNGIAKITFNPKSNLKAVYATINNQTLKIEVKDKDDSTMTAKNLVKTYKNDSQLEVKLVDKNNHPLSNRKIGITIDSKTYTKITDENGIAKLNINLNVGTYDALVELLDDDYRSPAKTVKVTVLKDKTSLKANNLVKYYQNGSQLIVKLVNSNNKAISDKKIIFNVLNKDYIRTTNGNGIAKLNINRDKGYTAKIRFAGDKNYNASSKSVKITILKPKLTALKTKLKNKKDHFTVIFKDANGKVIKNAKVKFALNGKTFVKTTDSKGQAKIDISLKVGKSYAVKTSFYSKNPYGTTSLTAKIKVV